MTNPSFTPKERLLSLAQDGSVSTRTLKAYGKKEMEQTVSGLIHRGTSWSILSERKTTYHERR